MACISFAEPGQTTWFAAKWAFSRFLDDVAATRPSDPKFVYAIEQAEALFGLHLDIRQEEDPQLAEDLKGAIQRVALKTLSNPDDPELRWKVNLDPDGQRIYLDGIRKLVEIIESNTKGKVNWKSGVE